MTKTNPIALRIANRYEVETFIAQGGMGAVYRARDTHTGQMVAIKHLLRSSVTDANALIERFVREGEALRVLNHPNIVAMHDAFQENGEYYLIMDYIDGGSLSDLLAHDPRLPVDRVIQLALDIADALTRAHRLKIVHRDLKPANILISADGTPRLTDFGVAAIGGESPVTATGMVIGTLAYLPPEALSGEPIDARGDIWAFGVMLFEMLVGHRPFEGDSLTALTAAIMAARVPDLEAMRPDLPPALIDLIYRMLDKDKLSRIGSMRQVGAELESLLVGGTQPRTHVIRIPISPASVTPTPSTGSRSASAMPRSLPTQTTPFVGREEELAELAALLADPGVRLITILAQGGMGKTRLSIEAVAEQYRKMPHHVPDGVFFTPLAPLTSPDQILAAIAESVHFQFYQGSPARDQLLDFFREKTLLLVLDNFEHLLIGTNSPGTELIADLLQAAPGLKIIVTSRERLTLQVETVFRLEGMNFPEWETPKDALEYSAIQLFVQSARRARPGFVLIAEQLPFIARICRLVYGLPLGILLAAAWVDSLSLAEIAEEIGKNIDFLETEARDVPSRQRSLRAVFDYSMNLLSADEQMCFAQLSVFRGGFTRDAAQAITNTSLRTLTALINKSLLRRAADGRYEVHELLRQYAALKLADNPTLRDTTRSAHTRYYSTFLERQLPRLTTHEQADAIRQMETEMDNIREGWKAGVEFRDMESLMRAWEPLLVFYLRYAPNESDLSIFQATADALQNTPPEPDYILTRGMMLALCGFFKGYLGQRDAANRDLDEAARLLPADRYPREVIVLQIIRVLPKVLIEESLGESHQHSLDRLQMALKLAEKVNDQWLIASLYSLMAWIYNAQGNYPHSLELTTRSLAMMREMGDELGQIGGLFALGWGSLYRGDYAQASALFGEIATIHRKFSARRPLGYALLSLSDAALHTGELNIARDHILEATEQFRVVGDRRGVTISLANLGRIAEQEQNLSEANRLFTETVAKARAIGNPALLATSLNGLARVEAALGRDLEARLSWQESLRLALEAETIRVVLDALIGLAGLFAKTRQTARAVTILSFVDQQAATIAEGHQTAQEQLSTLRAGLSAKAFDSAHKRGQSADLNTITADALAG